MSRPQHTPPVLWYQIIGYGAQVNRWMREPLGRYFLGLNSIAKTLFPPPLVLVDRDGRDYEKGEKEKPKARQAVRNEHGGAGLTLGITDDGSSFLLISQQQLLALLLELNIPPHMLDNVGTPGFQSSRFRSLSPIHFATHEALKSKLNALNPKPGKKMTLDSCSANKAYAMETNPGRREEVARRRSGFEYSRVLWRSLYLNEDLSLYMQSWKGAISGISTLAFTTQYHSHKDAALTLLDMAWSQVTIKDAGQNDNSKTEDHDVVHLCLPDLDYLQTEASDYSARFKQAMPEGRATTQTLTLEECGQLLNAHFDEITAKHRQDSSRPHILLVHDKDRTFQVLENLKVKTSGWVSGLDALLRHTTGRMEPYNRGGYSSRSSPYKRENSYKPRDSRERSPPPRRGSSYYDRDTPESSSYRSYDRDRRPYGRESDSDRKWEKPEPEPSCAPIHVIDIRELYGIVSLREVHSAQVTPVTIREVCVKLGVADEKEGWCAGLDAEYIYEAWQSLSGGSAIDERSKELRALTTKVGENPNASAELGLHGEGANGDGPADWSDLEEDTGDDYY